MRILYVAKHDSGYNDDEGAVHHALTQLGHDVQRVREHLGHKACRVAGVDFALFHKWSDLASITSLNCPKVFWYWDLVNWPNDPSLSGRNQGRINWMLSILPHVDLGFCTDGDWVAQDRTGKLIWLSQGADGRITGRLAIEQRQPLLFTGISRGGGRDRESFVMEMEERYGGDFKHITSGCYREDLRTEIGRTKIVVAPDSPTTDNYWSIRVYTALGFGAFLLHPYAEMLAAQYRDREDIVFYRSREHLHELIAKYRDDETERTRIAENGLAKTTEQHLYFHRCQQLVSTVHERLGV